ncbi:helix-turn-helix domain-containing protein [Candidatus Bathyarchaeota archaeon]|nr:helix-turn-helix domain-containing protein [Candidatus Bathyarchaeota archaeon]MBS7630619.1 helix-turn-helix domain-containing protein [Candidatus Bathyarchaeota archaeon]
MKYNDTTYEMLSRRIAGEIVISPSPGKTMKKWRNLFGVSQIELSDALDCSPSVISDYESGRRRSPGAGFIKKFVKALITIDKNRGGDYLRQIAKATFTPSDVFIDIREFATPVTVEELVHSVEGEVLTGGDRLQQNIFGYTVVDSLKAIQNLSGLDFYRVFGATSERALVFTGVSSGRSPMIAVKISPFKPRIVVLHGSIRKIDQLALSLASNEKITLTISRIPDQDELISALLDLYKSTQD